MPDVLSGLIWVQAICKGYEQITLVGSEFYRMKKHQIVYGNHVLQCYTSKSELNVKKLLEKDVFHSYSKFGI